MKIKDARLKLDTILRDITTNVYYQPTKNTSIKYPCIMYELSDIYKKYANDDTYINDVEFSITLVVVKPTSEELELINDISKMEFDRYMLVENLYHYYYKYTI